LHEEQSTFYAEVLLNILFVYVHSETPKSKCLDELKQRFWHFIPNRWCWKKKSNFRNNGRL